MTTTVRMLLAAAALMLRAGALGLRSRGDESSRAQVNRHGAELTEGK